jgi:tetratricopeptide (TPR) repeat protein
VLYECLTGRPPFKAATPLDTVLQVLSEEPVPVRRLQPRAPADLEAVCGKCLEKAPAKRYASAAELADDLRRYRAGRPTLARPAGPLRRLGKFARRHRGAVAAASLVLLTLVGGVAGTTAGMVRAQSERDNARSAEAETRRLLSESHHDAARLAMQRGGWREALAALDRAAAAGLPDSAGLRLDRVRALFALHESARAIAELDSLAGRTDLGDLEGRVLLWRADVILGQLGREDEALGLVRQALARGGLTPAETAYAGGLLAATPAEAARQFRAALEADSLHQRANAMLALLMVLEGRSREADTRLSLAELFFPQDPTFRLLRALKAAAEGDPAAARAQLDRARPQLGARQATAAEALADLLDQARQVERVLSDDPGASLPRMALKFAPAVTRLAGAVGGWQAREADAVLLLPVPPALFRAWGELRQALPRAVLGNASDQALDALARAAENQPDAVLYLLQGMLLGTRGRDAAAEEAFTRAAEAPSLVPVRRPALYFAVIFEGDLAKKGPEAERPEMRRRVLANTRQLLALGGISPSQAYGLSTMTLALGETGLARQVITEWERVAPADDPKLLAQRAYLEFHAGAYGRAADLADRLLTRAPGQAAEWRKLRAAAVESVRRQAERFGVAAKNPLSPGQEVEPRAAGIAPR